MAAGSKRRRTTLFGACLIVAAVGVSWCAGAGKSPETQSLPVDALPKVFAAVLPASVDVALPVAPETPPSHPESPAPVIDEILVEKSEVCVGEENLISVRAHTLDGSDPYLHYVVAGVTGQRVPLRVWADDDGAEEPPPLTVTVFGRGNVSTTAPIPPFVVKSCKVARSLVLTSRIRANTWGEYDLEARIVGHRNDEGTASPSKPFHPKRYEWTFGDGKTLTTSAPSVVHSFEDRPQQTQYENILVSVTATSDTGEQLTGRLSLQLLNPVFEDLHTKGVVSLLVSLTPRFPQMDADGVVRQRIRLSHLRERPVFLQSMMVFGHPLEGLPPAAPKITTPSTVIGTDVIPPGKGVEFEVKLDTQQNPSLFSVEHYLEGRDSEGLPVRGAFSVMRPPPRPTKERSQPVTDPELKRKIIAARSILGTDYVTDEDLWRLEREGKLPQPEPLPPAAPPKDYEPNGPPKVPEGPGPTAPGGQGDLLHPMKR